jgi:D-glycero-alpha-D-manno-heptose-7-phosphate kinase
MSILSTQTPLRISYLGGGSDFLSFNQENEGNVLGCTFDWYVYTHFLPIPPIASENYRLTYRKTESVMNYEEFEHPVVREVMKYLDWNIPINIATLSDVPGRTGLGSSSSFTVGLIQGLFDCIGKSLAVEELAEIAIQIERVYLNEPGGQQDQCHAAFGGFRKYRFSENRIEPSPLILDEENLAEFSKCNLLVWTAQPRINSQVSERHQNRLMSDDGVQLARELSNLAASAYEMILQEPNWENALNTISSKLEINWQIKLELGEIKTNSKFEYLSEIAKSCGIRAKKILGSGDSGFCLFLGEPEQILLLKKLLDKEFTYSPMLNSQGSSLHGKMK